MIVSQASAVHAPIRSLRVRLLIDKVRQDVWIWGTTILILVLQVAVLGEEATSRRFSAEQLAMLVRCSEHEDVNEWNEWRIMHPNADILLEDVLLEGVHLAGVYLNSGRFVDKTGAELEFTGQVYLRNTRLNYADLKEANFEGAHLEQARLSGANLTASRLARARIPQGHFFQANLEEADLGEADLREASMEQANLQRASLTSANMERSKLQRANLKYARLDSVNLQSGQLTQTKMDYATLEGAMLKGADLSYSILWNARLRNANLDYANLKGVNFSVTGLEDASLNGANIEDAIFLETYLQGASLRACIVNGRTWINTRQIDNHTDFRGVALGSVRIESTPRQRLEYNKRRLNWEDWYEDHQLQQWMVRLFWLMSNYGASTLRVITSFMIVVAVFSSLYFVLALKNIRVLDGLCEDPAQSSSRGLHLKMLFRCVYFSIVTMTTLGFGDIKAHRKSTVGQFIVVAQVVCGYLLLGALITRLGILFTAAGPSG